MDHRLWVAALALMAGLGSAAVAQDSDGDGIADPEDLDANGNGIPDADEPSGPGGGRMEAECTATARPGICLAYYEFNCNYYGFAAACWMAQVGANCRAGGDPAGCDYFTGLLQANTACAYGDQGACGYLAQQPIPR